MYALMKPNTDIRLTAKLFYTENEAWEWAKLHGLGEYEYNIVKI